nr:MAG TPA: hypothetical protein [Caudoviricetes sp.]
MYRVALPAQIYNCLFDPQIYGRGSLRRLALSQSG